MGTHSFISIYEQQPAEPLPDGSFAPCVSDHICTIMRTTDGGDAYDKALQFTDSVTIVRGAYIGMPAHEINGAGRFAIQLLAIVGAGWEAYTTLCPELTQEDMDDGDIFLEINCPFEGNPEHSAYSLEG